MLPIAKNIFEELKLQLIAYCTSGRHKDEPLQFRQEELKSDFLESRLDGDKYYNGKVFNGKFEKGDNFISINTVLDSDGNTALHFATQNNNDEVFDKLIKAGAKTDIENVKGERAIDIALLKAYTVYELERVDLLNKMGASLDSLDQENFDVKFTQSLIEDGVFNESPELSSRYGLASESYNQSPRYGLASESSSPRYGLASESSNQSPRFGSEPESPNTSPTLNAQREKIKEKLKEDSAKGH